MEGMFRKIGGALDKHENHSFSNTRPVCMGWAKDPKKEAKKFNFSKFTGKGYKANKSTFNRILKERIEKGN